MMASGLETGLPSLTPQDVLESASRLVDKHLSEDGDYLDLSRLLEIREHAQISISGLHDFDYPNMMEAGLSPDTLAEFVITKWTPLPPLVVQEFGRVQCNFLMGLFPEIKRAWLTIDSDIYVWKYEDGTDLAYFDELNETILCAGLVKPKPGVFQPFVQYLLVLATPLNIVVLGVSFIKQFKGDLTGSFDEEMHLLPEPLLSVATESTYFTHICGTDSGRIFLAGKDGCLHEVIYKATDSWFSSKCKKTNHSVGVFSMFTPSFFSFSENDPLAQISVDNSRHLLYTRSEKGTISVYDLGADGKQISKISGSSSQSIFQQVSLVASTIEKTHFGSIVHISPLTKRDSAEIHLVAITTSGVRLYFTTVPFNTTTRRPCCLTLVHIRLPPGFSASSISTRPLQNVHMAYYKKGSLLLLASHSEESDLLLGIGSDTFPFQSKLMETQTILPIEGKTKAVYEVPNLSEAPVGNRVQGEVRPDPPAVVTQHIEPPRKFVLLTSLGCTILSKKRPSEQLQQLLIDCQGPEAEEVKAFFRLHKPDHACATCLALACSRPPDPHIGDWARVAFFLYGGEARYNYSLMSGGGHMPASMEPGGYMSGGMSMYSPGSLSSSVVFGPHTHNTSFGAMPTPVQGMQPTHMSTPAPGIMQGYSQPMYPSGVASLPGYIHEVIFSGKHNGICIYLSRILSTFWYYNVCIDFQSQTTQGLVSYLGSAFSVDELTVALELIRDLSDFMEINSRFETGSQTDSVTSTVHFQPRMLGRLDENTKKRLHMEAQKMEKISLQHIKDLLHRVEEILGLWKLLVSHQFHAIAEVLPKDQQDQLRIFSFRQLVVNGKEICSSLISCLIKRYLDDNAPIEAISTKLRETCPSLYSYNDAIYSKANELLHAARINSNQLEKKQQLQEALKLLKEVTTPMQLPPVCRQFVSVNFFEGIVELILAVAKKCDPYNLALHYYQSGEPADDLQGMQVYMQRKECYNCFTNTLAYLWSASTSHQQVTKQPGPPPAPDPTRLTAAEAEHYKNTMLDLGLKSDDALFHSTVYDWLFATNKLQKLLEIQTPYIEDYLKRKSQMQADNVDALDMLSNYYIMIQNFPAAAKILSSLAERDKNDLDIPLDKRIEYLARAIVCARCPPSRFSSAVDGEFLHELEDKMEVARLQLQVRQALLNLPKKYEIEEALNRLNSELVDITTLYEDFADKFDLPEYKLAIVHCAGHHDTALIENLWKNIIEKEISTVSKTSPQALVSTLTSRLVEIAKLYASTERYFPLPFIVKYLEQRSCELNLDPNWVFQALLKIGVNPEKLLEIYDRMSKDMNWQPSPKPIHLLTVLHGFIAHFTDNPKLISDRRRFAVRCLEAVSGYLVELQAMDSSDYQVKNLLHNFRQLQAKLERMGQVSY